MIELPYVTQSFLNLWGVVSYVCCSSQFAQYDAAQWAWFLIGDGDTNSESTLCGSSLEPVVGIETCRWGKERRGGCENFLKLFAVSPFRTRWSSLVEIEKLLFCISSDKKWLSVYLNWHSRVSYSETPQPSELHVLMKHGMLSITLWYEIYETWCIVW